MLPVFDRHGNLLSGGTKATVTGGGVRGDTVRLALYEGSPRMLLSIAHPIAGGFNIELLCLENCHVAKKIILYITPKIIFVDSEHT